MRKHVALMALAAAGALAFGGTYAQAANIGVLGTKVIVVSKTTGSKAVFVSKDAGITKGPGTDTTLIDASLDIAYDNGTDAPINGQFLAPSGVLWLVNKSTVAKYVNKPAPTGGGTKVSVIKPAKLAKLVGKNLGDTPLNINTQSSAATGVAQTAYCVNNDGDSNCFCSIFATCAWKSIAGGTGSKLVCKGGTADALCSAIAPPPPYLSFRTGAPVGSCGTVRSGGALGAIRKTLGCGGLNVGGGASTVAEGPTPGNAETQFNISGGPVYAVSGRTAAQTGAADNCSDVGCPFGPYLPIANAGTSTCVRNTFAVAGSGTLDSTTGDFTGALPLTSTVYLTANGSSPCPLCLGGIPGVAGSGTCDATWTSGVGPSPDAGLACKPVNVAGDSHECDPPVLAVLPSFPVLLSPITTGTASDSDPGGLFCPLQATTGAFGCAGNGSAPNAICPGGDVAPLIDYIAEVGSASGPVTALPTATTLASTFCIPSVGGGLGFLINAAANLPGPGATSLPGDFSIVP